MSTDMLGFSVVKGQPTEGELVALSAAVFQLQQIQTEVEPEIVDGSLWSLTALPDPEKVIQQQPGGLSHWQRSATLEGLWLL